MGPEPLHAADRQSPCPDPPQPPPQIRVIVAAEGICRRQRCQTQANAVQIATKQKGRQIALPPPRSLERMTYFRLVIAVRSAESLTMPDAPHQLDLVPFASIPVGVPGVALKAPVKALQLAELKSLSE
jgi:hypothetical protein